MKVKALGPPPLLVGEMNPYGADPYFALYPAPDGCSGHRLCYNILGMRRKAYLGYFNRTNMCSGKWTMKEAYKRAEELRTYPGVLILLGSKVARAFEIGPFEPFNTYDLGRTLVLPHPSGLCRIWQEEGAVDKARQIIKDLLPYLGPHVGVQDEDHK